MVCITSQIPEKFKSTCTSDAARPRVSSFSGLVFCHLQALRHPTSPPPRGHGRSVLMCGSLTTATWRQQFQLMSYPFHKQRDPVLDPAHFLLEHLLPSVLPWTLAFAQVKGTKFLIRRLHCAYCLNIDY